MFYIGHILFQGQSSLWFGWQWLTMESGSGCVSANKTISFVYVSVSSSWPIGFSSEICDYFLHTLRNQPVAEYPYPIALNPLDKIGLFLVCVCVGGGLETQILQLLTKSPPLNPILNKLNLIHITSHQLPMTAYKNTAPHDSRSFTLSNRLSSFPSPLNRN
jgi:hypothetical protein